MSRFEQLFNEAHSYYKNQQIDLALEKIKIAEELPQNYEEGKLNYEELIIFKGSLLFLTGDLEKAQEAFVLALQKNPQSVEACLGLGKIYVSLDMFDEAKTMFEWAVKNNVEDENAKKTLAEINKLLGYESDHNYLFIQESIATERRNFNELFDSAYDKFLGDDFEGALAQVDRLEKLFVEDLNMFKGNVYLAIDDLDKSKESFEKVIKVNEVSIAAYNGLAKIYSNKNMFKDSKAMYELALKIDPHDSFATMGLAEVNQKLGLPPVHSIFTFLVDKQISGEINDYLNAAYSLFESEKFNESIQKLELVEQKIRNSNEEKKNELLSSVLNFKGFNYLALNRLEDARELFELSLRLNPGSSQACAGLGEYFYLNNKDKESKTMFEWAVKNNPDNYFAIQGLSKVNKLFNYPLDHSSLDLGIPDEINDEFVKFVTSAYENYDKKEFTKAVELLDKAMKLLLSVNDEIHSQKQMISLKNFKGFNYLSLGENEMAKECFEYSLEKNPNSSQAAAGLGQLLFLEGKDNEAKTMFEYAIQYEPRNAFAIAGLRNANKALGLQENDNSLVPKIKKEKTAQVGVLIDSAYTSFQEKKFDDTIKSLDEAEFIIEDNFSKEENYETVTRINNFKGFAYLSLKDELKAKTCFEKALQLSPNSSQSCAGLGEVFYLLGKDQDSKVMFEWAVKNNPQNNYAVSGLSKINTELGLSANHNSLL